MKLDLGAEVGGRYSFQTIMYFSEGLAADVRADLSDFLWTSLRDTLRASLWSALRSLP